MSSCHLLIGERLKSAISQDTFAHYFATWARKVRSPVVTPYVPPPVDMPTTQVSLRHCTTSLRHLATHTLLVGAYQPDTISQELSWIESLKVAVLSEATTAKVSLVKHRATPTYWSSTNSTHPHFQPLRRKHLQLQRSAASRICLACALKTLKTTLEELVRIGFPTPVVALCSHPAHPLLSPVSQRMPLSRSWASWCSRRSVLRCQLTRVARPFSRTNRFVACVLRVSASVLTPHLTLSLPPYTSTPRATYRSTCCTHQQAATVLRAASKPPPECRSRLAQQQQISLLLPSNAGMLPAQRALPTRTGGGKWLPP